MHKVFPARMTRITTPPGAPPLDDIVIVVTGKTGYEEGLATG